MREAIAASNAAQKATSTVANAVVAAADGRFGAIATGTAGGGDSVVWVNPLMSMYWAFDLDAVVERLAYASALEGTATIRDVIRNVISWRRAHPSSRKSAPRIPI